MLDITIIVPLKKLGKAEEKYLNTALKSITEINGKESLSLMFVGPKKVIEKAFEKAEAIFKTTEIAIQCDLIVNDDTNIFEQINKAVFSCVSKYFSILELDDAYTPNWMTSAERFIKPNDGKSVYLMMEEIINKDGISQYFANEMAWNPAYTGDDLGVITTDSMKAYPNFIFSGAIIKVDDFIGVHGLKPSMKIAAWYEFALRLLNNKKEIYVIPKIGYKHMVGREDSYDEVMRKNITVEEGRWLIETAEEECKFDEDRKLEYVKNDASKQ